MKKNVPNQKERVLAYIKKHGSITQKQADKIAVKRLPSRIFDLREMGYTIVSDMVKVKNRYGETCRVARYRLAAEE